MRNFLRIIKRDVEPRSYTDFQNPANSQWNDFRTLEHAWVLTTGEMHELWKQVFIINSHGFEGITRLDWFFDELHVISGIQFFDCLFLTKNLFSIKVMEDYIILG